MSRACGVLLATTQGTNVPAILHFTDMCTAFNEANANSVSDHAYPAPFPGSSGAIAAAIPLDSSLQVQVAFAQDAVFKNPQVHRNCPDAGAPAARRWPRLP